MKTVCIRLDVSATFFLSLFFQNVNRARVYVNVFTGGEYWIGLDSKEKRKNRSNCFYLSINFFYLSNKHTVTHIPDRIVHCLPLFLFYELVLSIVHCLSLFLILQRRRGINLTLHTVGFLIHFSFFHRLRWFQYRLKTRKQVLCHCYQLIEKLVDVRCGHIDKYTRSDLIIKIKIKIPKS